MIPFILHPGTVYTDTESIFNKTPLYDDLIDNELGLMIDELNGQIIEEAIFLDIKKYGYWYLDKNKNRIECSIVVVSRNTIKFDEIKNIFKGSIIKNKNKKCSN
jgi:hypothetical protein